MKIEIGVIPGDGIGPEIMDAALKVLEAVTKKYHHELVLHQVLASGEAIEKVGNPMPEESLELCKKMRAVLLGNTGLAKYQNEPLERRPEQTLLKLRRALSVSTNVRPVRLYSGLEELSPLKREIVDKGMDILFVRDIVGGILCSEKITAQGSKGKEAYEYEYYNEEIIRNTVTCAFEFARKRNAKITSLDKSNVLASSRLWRQIVIEISKGYPDVQLNHYYIDTAAMKLIEAPHEFDVVVTANVFGDIISDEGTQLTGSACLYASAELSAQGQGIFTPNQLHHPDETLTGRKQANPIGMIAAVALMLRNSFGLEKEAKAIEKAISRTLAEGYVTKDMELSGHNVLDTIAMQEMVVKELNKL